MAPTRREFIKQSGSVLAGATGIGAFGPQMFYGSSKNEAEQPPTLIVLYLRGGADPLNAIVPYGDPLYYELRPTIAVPQTGNPDLPGIIPLDRYFGFHPSMKELADLFRAKMMAPILNVGSTHPTRSHFDAQDFMERAAPGIKYITEGWLNRYLTATRTADDRDLRSVSLQPLLPRSLRGAYPVLAVPNYGAEHAMNVFESLYGCEGMKVASKALKSTDDKGSNETAHQQSSLQRIVDAGSQGIAKLRNLNAIVNNPHYISTPVYPAGYLATQLRDLAKIIKSNQGLEVAAIDYGNWDHHAYQGASVGTMGGMLSIVSQTIKAFVDDLGPRMNKTLILVMSEFGRTVKENGTNGSDHGHGGFMLAIGGPVRGGRFYGKWTGLTNDMLYEGRDMPVYTDFRMVFAETLLSLFGFRADQHNFFPKYKANRKPLGFLHPLANA